MPTRLHWSGRRFSLKAQGLSPDRRGSIGSAEEVENYLSISADRYERGQVEYFARLSLAQALHAHRRGDYAIGAIGVLASKTLVQQYESGNAMITGLGVVDHAETRVLLDIKQAKRPSQAYPRQLNAWTAALPDGLSVFGTLEPCPMCTCALINVGAQRSISTGLDGKLVEEGGWRFSDGAASSIGEKSRAQPAVWRQIQRTQGLTFELLATNDQQLVSLSRRLFEETRHEVDLKLSERKLRR